MTTLTKKELTAKKAYNTYLHYFEDQNCIIGLGSGSTADILIDQIDPSLTKAQFVATSTQSEARAKQKGLTIIEDYSSIDITFDGADEIILDTGDRLKGGGGCLLREKIIREASRINVILIDDGKISEKLAQKFYLPVEITPFASDETKRKISLILNIYSPKLILRQTNNHTFITDNKNYIFDTKLSTPIDDPGLLLKALKLITGVVEVGIFCGKKNDIVIIGKEDGATIKEFK